MLTVTLRLSGAVDGDFYVSIHPQGASGLLTRPGTPPIEDLEAAWLGFVREAGSRLATQLPSGFGALSIADCSMKRATNGLAFLANVELRGGHGVKGTVLLQVSPELSQSLAALSAAPGRETVRSPEATENRPPLQRVIDVPLQVTLRFGQRHLTLRELLALSTGSLVELDRQVEEPVDLMLGERVVARGEVVIVDGNYGLRVTEVVERTPGGTRAMQSTPILNPVSSGEAQ